MSKVEGFSVAAYFNLWMLFCSFDETFAINITCMSTRDENLITQRSNAANYETSEQDTPNCMFPVKHVVECACTPALCINMLLFVRFTFMILYHYDLFRDWVKLISLAIINFCNDVTSDVLEFLIYSRPFLICSNDVSQSIEVEGVLHPLIGSLKNSEVSESFMEKALDILARILDPSKEMKSKFYEGPVDGSKKEQVATRKTGSAGNVDEMPVSNSTTSLQTADARDLLDSAAIARLVELLKNSSPNLQRKAVSVLEFVTLSGQSIDTIISAEIESGLDAVFQQRCLHDSELEMDFQQPELHALEVEEAGLAVSAASRLLTRLLDFEPFCSTINPSGFIKLLRKILRSSIPLHYKEWVAACLVKLSSLSGPNIGFGNPIDLEVTLYETIPRLIEQIQSFSPEAQEAAVVELNRIISDGVVDSTRAVADQGGIYPLVKLIEEGTDRAVEAGLAILYNLSMDTENHLAILAAGAVPALKRIILSKRPQWTRALRLLRTLPT